MRSVFRMYAASLSPDLVPSTAARFARTYSSPGGLRIDRILGDTYARKDTNHIRLLKR